jgi:ribosome-binding protein aMBF1 (putative translation factor)
MENGFQTQIDSRTVRAASRSEKTLRERMQMEIQAVDDLKAGKVEITMGSIEDLPKVLIQKRIGLGMTQKELAAKLGIKEQMVQSIGCETSRLFERTAKMVSAQFGDRG